MVYHHFPHDARTRVRLTLRGDVLCSGLGQRSPWLPVKPRHGIKKTSGLWRRVYLKSGFSEFGSGIRLKFYQIITHRIHGAGIYANIYHQYTPVMLAYIPAPWIRHGLLGRKQLRTRGIPPCSGGQWLVNLC